MRGLWRRLVHGVRRVEHRPDWPRFAGHDWLERIMHVETTDRFHAKQGRSTGRWIMLDESGRLAVYLKRHYRLPWWRRLLATLQPAGGWSPAFAEKKHLDWAKSRGIPVPPATAAGEFIGPWFRFQSFLAVEELDAMMPLHEAIPLAERQLGPREFARWKRTLIDELARLSRLLHEAGRFHKDYYLCHFYVGPEDIEACPDSFTNRVFLIDLHRLGRHLLTRPYWQVKDLAQLFYSSHVSGVSDRDRLRFFSRYMGRRSPARRLLNEVVRKGDRYRRHNERRSMFQSSQAAEAPKPIEGRRPVESRQGVP